MAGSKQLLLVALSLLFFCIHRPICCTEEEKKVPSSNLPGHMQPLGSHMEPELVRRLDHMIPPPEFYEDYVVPKRPVIFEGLLSQTDVLKNWQSDDYLRYSPPHSAAPPPPHNNHTTTNKPSSRPSISVKSN